MLTQTMELELAPYQIRVNAIAPGYVPHEYINELDRSFNEIPLRRAGRPEDIATAALFLVSEDSSWMTGQIMTLDGGHSIALSNPP
jgi:3-oxoacyl-[acyl-carrier protein] reductase